MMNFNEILTADYTALDGGQQEFVRLHREIMANGVAAAAHLGEMARGLKEMRDGGKYRAAGFESFGAYTESACGIKERQAYNYISVIENLPEEFLQSNAKIGISKLTMLASMNSSDRADLIAKHGDELEDLSARELDKLKKEYEAQMQQMQIDFQSLIQEKDSEIEKLQDEINIAGDYVENTQNQDDLHAQELAEAEAEKAALRAEIDALKTAPKADDRAAAALEKKKAEIKKLKEAKAAAEKTAAEAKERADKEIAAAIEKEREAVKKIEKDLELERARILSEAKKAKIAADPIMSEYKARFGMWQEIGNGLLDLIGKMESENATKCKKAFRAIAEEWAK